MVRVPFHPVSGFALCFNSTQTSARQKASRLICDTHIYERYMYVFICGNVVSDFSPANTVRFFLAFYLAVFPACVLAFFAAFLP